MYFVTAHPPPATAVETSSASVQLPDPNINFSTPTCSSKLPIESQTVYGDSSTTSPLDLSAGSSAGSLTISEFLVYPTVVTKAKPKQVSKSARILTSCESLALMEEKKQKKEEEEKEKARRKKEREEKRLAKESEKRQKQKERETKKAEQARKMEELAKKEEQAQRKGQQKKVNEAVGEYSGQKRKLTCGSVKVYPIRKRAKSDSTSTSNQQSGQDTCSVCFGVYKDDVDGVYCLVVTGSSVVKMTVGSGVILIVWKNVMEDICVLSVSVILYELLFFWCSFASFKLDNNIFDFL